MSEIQISYAVLLFISRFTGIDVSVVVVLMNYNLFSEYLDLN